MGTATDAVIGALIVTGSANVSAQLAVPIVIVSYMLSGLGFFFAMLVLACYFAKLVNHGLPPPKLTPGLFILVGPPGQSASGMLLLGSAAKQHFGAYQEGTFLTGAAGEIADTVGVLLALLMLGLGIIFLMFAVYINIDVALRRQHEYSLVWWSTIFPVATVNTAWIALASDMDSSAFRVLAVIFVLILVLGFCVNSVFTLYHICTSQTVKGSQENRQQSASAKVETPNV